MKRRNWDANTKTKIVLEEEGFFVWNDLPPFLCAKANILRLSPEVVLCQ
ncbi:MAG: hypothetical protein V3U58_01600 [Thermodesulfobacteriota bacterium]